MSIPTKGFPELLERMPADFRVLDVGCGGLNGENTSRYLIEKFGVKNIVGYSLKPEKVFCDAFPDLDLRRENFYENLPKEKFDLVVLDLNIENNLKDWSEERLAMMRGLVKDGGYLINYVMTTDDYGDPNETPALIRQHWKEFWQTEQRNPVEIIKRMQKVKGWEVDMTLFEPKRDYIIWVLLEKISGL